MGSSLKEERAKLQEVRTGINSDHGLDEEELERRKAREVELDENQIIVREAEAKGNVEREAQVTLESTTHLFPMWTLQRIQSEVVDSPINIG
ncbi:unnamed protein product [Lactuca saligna]|uniref:Uncharacterized protein n=1 Tax=Lactuca saligna TaxID=75948 RepID=A0AA35Z8X6_LACSI|nr:unnamed protein product [Lactuca saligna]